MTIEKEKTHASIKRKKKIFKRIVLSVIGILLLVGIFGFFFLNNFVKKSLPQVEGTIELSVNEEVIVSTDSNGVPHIKAENEQDLYTAQGYVQAQSRMFQMELSRRQASGTLSELIGDGTVANDKYFRTLGLRRAAEKSYKAYSDDAKKVLQWFSDGVNAYMENAIANNTLPVEFTIINAEPEEWTPIDSLTIGKYMAFDLGGHWERQAFNYYLLNEFSQEKAYELFPTYPEERMKIIEETEIDIATSFKDAIIPEPFNGSNNWVISGEKTASGKPLLADDPHLGLATPSVWYQMHLEAEDLNVSGVIFAGVPGIILGHNEDVAWGVTNTGPDVQQLYIEKRNPENKSEFLFDGEWEEATIIEEPIKVKGEKTIAYEVVETRHGPVVSEFAEESGEDAVLSLSWTALDATTELQAILKLNKASNWEEFEKGLEDFLAPAQNFVFASTDGTIAYKANGRIPIYEKAADALLPLPGWEEKYELDEFIPFDELPKVINPDKGFIATANNKVVGDAYPYHISNVWAQPYRYERIYEVLDEQNDFTIQHMKDLQMDAVNLRGKEFVPVFIEALESESLSAGAESALETLNDWNYIDDKELAAPLLFDQWIVQIEHILYEELSEDVMALFGSKGQTTDTLLRAANNSIWVDDQGGINTLLKQSLEKTVEDLTETYGANQDKWKWGDYHQVLFKHPLASASKALAYFFNAGKSLPVDGSAVTAMAARGNEDGIVNHGASWRFVIDLDDISVGHHIVSPGQSGHFRSPWYSDQAEAWGDGIFHETGITEFEGTELILMPVK